MVIQGNYSKTINGGFDESRRLIMGFARKGIPWVDADENRKEWAKFTQLRRAFDVLIGDASPNNGFKPVGTSANNDFTIKGGDGTLNGAGRMYVSGIGCFLLSDINYANAGATYDQLSIFPVISFITMTTLPNDTIQDSAANFVPGELIGRTVTPDVTQPGITATVVANTANTIQLSANTALLGTGIAVGAHYRIELAPPVSGTRSDDIYLNASIIENSTDPVLENNLGTTLIAQYAGQITQTIYVKQGGGAITTDYTDVDGFEHFLTKIGTVARNAGQAAINSGDVVDLRATSGSLTAFVPKAGGTMTGNLQLNGADIVALTGTETIDGRLVHVDGAKLDTITWTPEGVAGQLALVSWPFQGTSLTGITTTSLNVSRYMKNRVPGGTTTQKGVFTTTPYNNVVIQDSTSLNDITDGSLPTPNKVYGRTTFLGQTLAGTLTYTFGGTTVGGAGTQFTTQTQVGDIIQGADLNWYTVASITSDTALTIVETYLGPNATGVPTVPRQRWVLNFFSLVVGVETAFTPPSAMNINWFWHEVFDEATRPVINPIFGIPSDQVTAEVPQASTTVRGSVLLAVPDGSDSTAGHVVQASDVRLAKITAMLGGTSQTGLEPILNFIQGTGVTIAITESGGKINITISNSSPGGGGPGSPQNPPPNVNLGGSSVQGSTGRYADEQHTHGGSAIKTPAFTCESQNYTSSPTVATGFTPVGAFFYGTWSGSFVSIGACNAGSPPTTQRTTNNAYNQAGSGNISSDSGGHTLVATQLNASSFMATLSGSSITMLTLIWGWQ